MCLRLTSARMFCTALKLCQYCECCGQTQCIMQCQNVLDDRRVSFFVLVAQAVDKQCFVLMYSSYYTVRRGKGKGHPRTGHDGPEEEQRYSSTFSLTSALDGGWWSTPRPGRFVLGLDYRYPLYRRLGDPQGRSGRVRKISPLTGIRSQDRPARSESLYRLSYPGPKQQQQQ